MKSLFERQIPIDTEIVNALVAATPEWWNAAEMHVFREDIENHEKMNIIISSPEGFKEPVSPTEDIYAGLYKLSDLFREHVNMWVSVAYRINQENDGWKYLVKFEY